MSEDDSLCSLGVFKHHIYEYQKGLRDLVLHTSPLTHQAEIIQTLNRYKIDFVIDQVCENKINVFYGNKQCIKIIKSFAKERLSDYTAEQDFILGIMLGYDRKQQYDRYLQRILGKNVEQLMG